MEAIEDAERQFELSGAVTHLFNHYRTNKDGWDHFFYFFVIEQKLLKPALVPLAQLQRLEEHVAQYFDQDTYKAHGTIVPAYLGDEEVALLTIFQRHTVLASAISFKKDGFQEVKPTPVSYTHLTLPTMLMV